MNLGAIVAIGYFDIKRYLRDKIALFTTLFLPVLLILVIGVASGGGGGGSLSVGVLDADGTATSEQFADDLRRGPLTWPATPTRRLAADVRLGAISGGDQIEPGFEATLASADGTAGVTLNARHASTNGTAVAASITSVADFALQPTAIRVSRPPSARRCRRTGRRVEHRRRGSVADATDLSGGRPDRDRREADLNGYATAVPTQLTLFVFLNGMLAGMTLVESRRLGVARRMLATPTGVGPHILGVGLGRWVLGLVQAAILLVVGAVLFGVDFAELGRLGLPWRRYRSGRRWPAAVGMVTGAVAKTPDQVVAVSVPLGIGMAMLGGSCGRCRWSPRSCAPSAISPRTRGPTTPGTRSSTRAAGIVAESPRARCAHSPSRSGCAVMAVVLLRRSLSR